MFNKIVINFKPKFGEDIIVILLLLNIYILLFQKN